MPPPRAPRNTFTVTAIQKGVSLLALQRIMGQDYLTAAATSFIPRPNRRETNSEANGRRRFRSSP
jgi:hypothetical protein